VRYERELLKSNASKNTSARMRNGHQADDDLIPLAGTTSFAFLPRVERSM